MPDNANLKISVITICYNEPKENIDLTFKSISNQTYKNIQWIVVDGGSKPETISAIKEYESYIDTFISEPDNGVYDAMNKGVSYANGEFVVFMNTGDCFYNEYTLNDIVDNINKYPNFDCYYGDPIVVDDNKKIWAGPQERKINRFILHNTTICHQATITKTELYKKIGGFDISYKIIADKEWILRSVDAGARWRYIDLIVCRYDKTGLSSDITQRKNENIKLVSNYYNVVERVVYYLTKKIRGIWRRLQRLWFKTYKGYPIKYT
ncbi:MAG: glycosyltransferase family 2 protein [Armatimonadota bacterium]